MADEYAPGVCNIGPAEIRKRMRGGHVAAAAALVLLVLLLLLQAPRPARFLVALPAALAAVGYIQAATHFCAAFGLIGSYNFGELGAAEKVMIDDARAADRRKAIGIGLVSAGIGLAVALVSMALPA